MKPLVKFSVIIFFLLAVGCSTPFVAAPTSAPTETVTSTSTPTPTQTATATPTKTRFPTQTPVVKLGETHVINEGGFSVRVPISYASQINEREVFISDLEGALVISFASIGSTSSEEEIIDEYLNALARRSDGEFEKTPAEPVTVDGLEGMAFDLTGSFAGSPLQGKTFIVPRDSNRFLFALGMSNIAEDETAWEEQGIKVFEAIVESIEFFEPESTGNCPIATDPTYGYTMENAIRVGDGGELFGGPARERTYLDNLRGPSGEPLSYERTGSLNYEDTILDEYVITSLGTSTKLYIDIYKFEALKAPAGFTCAGSFDLQP
ncbi:MAG TPA: hypothetical protein VFG81_17545 [Anaerolineales bacterium]|jgi:hypothetical protein|nr:hypothetical protein [Anaerolineales bacterium]